MTLSVDDAQELLENKLSKFDYDEEEIIELCKCLYKITNKNAYLELLASQYQALGIGNKAIEYAELAYQENPYASMPLAYYYYEGELIEPDYNKAYEYLKVSLTLKDKDDGIFGDGYTYIETSALELLADMYENGHYFKKDHEKYKEIICDLYQRVKDKEWYEERVGVLFKAAKLKEEEGRDIDVLEDCYDIVGDCQELLKYMTFDFYYEMCKWALEKIYKYTNFDPVTFLDLIPLLNRGKNVLIDINGHKELVTSELNNGKYAVMFNDEWYRDVGTFIIKATFKGKRLIEIQDDIEIEEIKDE